MNRREFLAAAGCVVPLAECVGYWKGLVCERE